MRRGEQGEGLCGVDRVELRTCIAQLRPRLLSRIIGAVSQRTCEHPSLDDVSRSTASGEGTRPPPTAMLRERRGGYGGAELSEINMAVHYNGQ